MGRMSDDEWGDEDQNEEEWGNEELVDPTSVDHALEEFKASTPKNTETVVHRMIQPDLKKKGSFTIVEHEEFVRKDEKMKSQAEIERQREKTRRRLEVIAAR